MSASGCSVFFGGDCVSGVVRYIAGAAPGRRPPGESSFPAAMLQPPLRVLQLYISPGHNYIGHHGRPPGENPTLAVPEIRCVPGRGIEGDRYFDFKENYKGQITFFAEDVYLRLCAELNVHDKTPAAFRRNVVCAGVALDTLYGRDFTVQGVVFRGREKCRPCYWMDQSFGPGAEKALRGSGGLRAEIVSAGVLRVDAGA